MYAFPEAMVLLLSDIKSSKMPRHLCGDPQAHGCQVASSINDGVTYLLSPIAAENSSQGKRHCERFLAVGDR